MDAATETNRPTRLVTPRQLREALQISRTTEWRMVRSGLLKPIYLPTGGRRYSGDEAPALIERARASSIKTPPTPAAAAA